MPTPRVLSRMTLYTEAMNLHSVKPVPISSFQKELVLQAVQKDQEGERSAALSLYCSALEHFVPAIHCKNNIYSHILCVAQTMHCLCSSTINWQCKLAKYETKMFPLSTLFRRDGQTA